MRPVSDLCGIRAFARFGFCVENVQGAFRRGRKHFLPSAYWGRTGNRDKLSRKNRDKRGSILDKMKNGIIYSVHMGYIVSIRYTAIQ